MAKKNGVKRTKAGRNAFYAAKQAAKQQEHEIWTMKVIAYTEQEMIDTMSLVLHDYFGWGQQRLHKFHDCFEEKHQEIMRLRQDDCEDLEYSEAKIEQALQAAWGTDYEPRSVRYDIHLVTGTGETIKL